MTVSPQQAPDKIENGHDRLRVGRAGDVNGKRLRRGQMVKRAQPDRRPQRHRPDRHGREPFRGHEEPRRLRSARHDDPLRGPRGDRATDARPRSDAPARSARPGGGRDGVLRLLVHGQDGRPAGLHPPGPAARDRRGAARISTRATSSSPPHEAPTACTTTGSPAWKGADRTTRPTPKAFCGSNRCRRACRRE